MSVYLFAGISVSNFTLAQAWYEQLFGSPPAFLPNDTEAVWEIAGHRYVYIEHRPEHAGHSMVTLLVPQLDERLQAIAAGGLEPARRETYDNGVEKITFRDPDGNEIGFGEAPPEQHS
jgi:catechol 2,3-dioxygenase-like lactoylglutathione lyase family enzyme